MKYAVLAAVALGLGMPAFADGQKTRTTQTKPVVSTQGAAAFGSLGMGGMIAVSLLAVAAVASAGGSSSSTR